MTSRLLRIEPLAGYTPIIGRLVCMLTYARQTTLSAVQGMTMGELDHLQDDTSNSIGALLAHIAVVERGYQSLTFDDRALSAEDLGPALTLGDQGRRHLRGKPLEHYVNELAEARRLTLEGFATRDDDWLERSPVVAPAMNTHWAWFHVAEDEISHRGQIHWLRKRLPGRERRS